MPNLFENIRTNDAAGNFDIKVTEADGDVTKFTPDQRWRLLMLAIYNTRLKRKVGNGTPEGAVTADEGWLYLDRVGSLLYVKIGDGTNTGWLLVGGGGGMITNQVFEDRAPAPPDDPTKAALSFPTGGGQMLQWPPSVGAWV